jgi:hypothetical protein
MERLGVEIRQCVWWNPDFGTSGAWDPAFCSVVETSPEVTSCECKRFGSIAVLREMSEKFEVKSACQVSILFIYDFFRTNFHPQTLDKYIFIPILWTNIHPHILDKFSSPNFRQIFI